MLLKPSLLASVLQENALAHDRLALGLLDASSHRESSTARRKGDSTPQTISLVVAVAADRRAVERVDE